MPCSGDVTTYEQPLRISAANTASEGYPPCPLRRITHRGHKTARPAVNLHQGRKVIRRSTPDIKISLFYHNQPCFKQIAPCLRNLRAESDWFLLSLRLRRIRDERCRPSRSAWSYGRCGQPSADGRRTYGQSYPTWPSRSYCRAFRKPLPYPRDSCRAP